jgi:CRP-like cAMP-binding protein
MGKEVAMPLMISPEKLRGLPIFAGLDMETIRSLAMVGEDVTFDKDYWIFHEGENADAFYIILDGSVELKMAIDSRRLRFAEVATLVAGDVLGWSALVDPYIYTMGAVTLTKTKLVKLNGVGVSEILTHAPAVGYTVMTRLAKIIGTRLDSLCTRMVSLVEGDQWQTFDDSSKPSNGKTHLSSTTPSNTEQ